MIWKTKNRCFTILEILICLVILTLIGGFFSVRGATLLSERKANTSVKRLSDELYLSKKISTLYGIDVEMELHQEGNKLIMVRHADSVPKTLTKHFSSKIEFPYVKLEGTSSNFVVTYYGSGWSDPTGPIELSYMTRDRKKRILDPLYPRGVLAKKNEK